ncbi:MAG: PD40 domain-containing protein [Sedimentisphaerales bacterium]|nr:PD40 domain-containing protein [Sedimentisphaerales bacterium]
MVRQMNQPSKKNWKAVLAIIVAGGALLWHILACTESPMSFSPDGKNLAFVVMEPKPDMDELYKGSATFRLMICSDNKTLYTVEETTEHILSGPAYSPDGKYLCYLRLPLLSKEEINARKEHFKELDQKLEEIEKSAQQDLPKSPADNTTDTSESQKSTDLTIPPAETIYESIKSLILATPFPAELVVRDPQNYNILATIRITLPVLEDSNTELYYNHLVMKPQFSPDSQWIYLPANNMIQAVNPETREVCILAAPAGMVADKLMITVAALSPDGKKFAVLYGSEEPATIAFYQTNGQTSLYQKIDFKVSLSGMAWKDNETLTLLSSGDNDSEIILYFMKTNGVLSDPLQIQLPQLTKEQKDEYIQLALAPNRDYMVITFVKDVFFLTGDGKLIKHHSIKDETRLTQAAFTPDSRQVAFKSVNEENISYVKSIMFFSNQGEEISKVDIPLVEMPGTISTSLSETPRNEPPK